MQNIFFPIFYFLYMYIYIYINLGQFFCCIKQDNGHMYHIRKNKN